TLGVPRETTVARAVARTRTAPGSRPNCTAENERLPWPSSAMSRNTGCAAGGSSHGIVASIAHAATSHGDGSRWSTPTAAETEPRDCHADQLYGSFPVNVRREAPVTTPPLPSMEAIKSAP